MPRGRKRAAANAVATVPAKRQRNANSPPVTGSKGVTTPEVSEKPPPKSKSKSVKQETPPAPAIAGKMTAKEKALAIQKQNEIVDVQNTRTGHMISYIRKFLKALEDERGKGLMVHLHKHRTIAAWIRKRTKSKMYRDPLKASIEYESFMENTTRLMGSDVGDSQPVKLRDFLIAEVPQMRTDHRPAIAICEGPIRPELYHCSVCGECYVGHEAFQVECGHTLCVRCARNKYTYCYSCKYNFHGWKLKRVFI